jgi:hypothetical protein
MSLARVQQISISFDGFATGEGQSHDAPFGHAGERLHEWMFATRSWRERVGEPGGNGGVDDAFLRLHDPGIGAEIMGAGKFGPPGWHEDPEWKGAWGPNPPFHTPTFVLTHHPRPSIEMEGGTTYHFLDASPAENARDGPRACGRPGRPHRRWSHHDPRLPCCRARRPHAPSGGPDPAWSRRTPLGRTGGPRAAVRDRGHLVAQRSHACDFHPCSSVNRLDREPRARNFDDFPNGPWQRHRQRTTTTSAGRCGQGHTPYVRSIRSPRLARDEFREGVESQEL